MPSYLYCTHVTMRTTDEGDGGIPREVIVERAEPCVILRSEASDLRTGKDVMRLSMQQHRVRLGMAAVLSSVIGITAVADELAFSVAPVAVRFTLVPRLRLGT